MANALAKGYAAIAGVKKQSAFTTPVACSAGDGIEYTSESLGANVQFIEDNEINGRAMRLAGDAGNKAISGSITMDAKYQGLDLLFAMALGTAGAPAQQGTTSAYKHTWKVADDVEGLHVTLAQKKISTSTAADGAVFEFYGGKVGGFNLSVAPGARAKAEFPLIFHDVNMNDASGTNNMTTIANVTLPSVREFLKFAQMEVFLNDQSGGALGASDEVYVNNFNLSLQRPFDPDYTTRYGDKIEEPATNGFVTMSGSISFPTFATEQKVRFTEQLLKTKKKMKVVFTGPVCDGAYNYSYTIWVPLVQFTEGTPQVGGPGKVPLSLNFQGGRSTSDPTGFPTGAGAAGLTIEAINQRTTDALA